VVASLALFIALAGGTAFAATQMLPKNSVGTAQIKGSAVTPAKLSAAAKKGMKGATGATGPIGPQGIQGVKGEPATALWAEIEENGAVYGSKAPVTVNVGGTGAYLVNFNKNVETCTSLATLNEQEKPGEIISYNAAGHGNSIWVETFDSKGNPQNNEFSLAIFC
jgi:hypothetical protein